MNLMSITKKTMHLLIYANAYCQMYIYIYIFPEMNMHIIKYTCIS